MSDTHGDDVETVILDDWCAEQSLRDRRVELLAVFRYREQRAGRQRDTRAAYAARYSQTEAAPTV